MTYVLAYALQHVGTYCSNLLLEFANMISIGLAHILNC